MACCLTTPSHYLNQCKLIISSGKWHYYEGRLIRLYLSHQSLKLEWVDGNADILSHPGPLQYPLPRGHIVVVFYIRASYRLPSLSFHDNRASASRDTIWPWKFKVKGKGQKHPSQCSVLLTPFLSVSHQGILWTPIPFVPWQSGLPFLRYNFTLKIQGQGQGQRCPSECSVQLTHFLSVSHQGTLSTPVPFVPWQLGLPFPRYNLTLKIQGQRSRSRSKVQ